MKQYFAKKIRTLRYSSDYTQEKLADYLGVSAQTVSKWERSETYPDIELLPAIANHFGVTIDDLLGNDSAQVEKEIDELITEIKESKDEDALELSREGYHKYPYSHKMMARYGKDLMLYCEGDARTAAYPEAEKIAKTLLEDSFDDNIRYDALEILHSVYGSTDKKKYKELCERIPDGFDFTRELWLEGVYSISTDKGIKLRQENMLELFWWFTNEVYELCGLYDGVQPQSLPDADTLINISKMELAILKCIFSDGDFGDYTWRMAYDSFRLFTLFFSKGERECALEYLTAAAAYSFEYETLPNYIRRTSFLVDHVPFDKDKDLVMGPCGSPEYYIGKLNDPMYNILKDDAKYLGALKTFESCPKRS